MMANSGRSFCDIYFCSYLNVLYIHASLNSINKIFTFSKPSSLSITPRNVVFEWWNKESQLVKGLLGTPAPGDSPKDLKTCEKYDIKIGTCVHDIYPCWSLREQIEHEGRNSAFTVNSGRCRLSGTDKARWWDVCSDSFCCFALKWVFRKEAW